MSYYTTAEKFQRIGRHLSIDEIFSDSVSGHDQQPFNLTVSELWNNTYYHKKCSKTNYDRANVKL